MASSSTAVTAAEAAFSAALVRMKAAAATDDLLEKRAAATNLTAAKRMVDKAVGRKKSKARKRSTALSDVVGDQAAGTLAGSVNGVNTKFVAPARLPGFGSPEYWASQPPNSAWAHYPLPRELPLGPASSPGGMQFTASFAVENRDEAVAFWEEWGFVVFHDVLTVDECDATVSEIWNSLEADYPGVKRNDPTSHDLLPVDRYGLATEQAVFTPQLVMNRQNPRIYDAIDAVTPGWDGDSTKNSIVVSADRWCYYPPSLNQPQRQTNNPGAHLDICPWEYLPRNEKTARNRDPEAEIDNLRYEG